MLQKQASDIHNFQPADNTAYPIAAEWPGFLVLAAPSVSGKLVVQTIKTRPVLAAALARASFSLSPCRLICLNNTSFGFYFYHLTCLSDTVLVCDQVVGEMGFFFGMRHITHARAHSSMPTTLFALPKADYSQLVKLYPDQVSHTTILPLGKEHAYQGLS